MYVCNCNGISEKTLGLALEGGAATPTEVFRACGGERACGRCVPEMQEALAAFRTLRGCGPCPFRTLGEVAPAVAAAS
jgi:bacterioferritin-associated ferredoxin